MYESSSGGSRRPAKLCRRCAADVRPPRASRRWLFRLFAVMIGLAPFAATELALRLFGLGLPTATSDPFVEFAAVRPLFVLNETSDRYIIPSSRQPFFKSDSFAARKGPREFRMFCLGDSTVQGNPYSIETSFTTWLKLSLQSADASRDWQVVNCGGISYASYRLAPILRECLQHQPDLFVIYTGHNEFLEDRTYGHIKAIPGWFAWLTRLRLFNVARQTWRSVSQRRQDASPRATPTELATEVEALLDYRGGLERYHRDDAWRSGVIEHFRFTLSRMVEQAQSAGVPVLLIDPVCNLKDCAPFKVETNNRLTNADRIRFQQLLESAAQTELPAEQTIESLLGALAIDSRHAGAWFLLGQAYLAVGRDVEAHEALVRAKEEDICPLRVIEPVREAIRDIGHSTGTAVIPVMRRFEEASTHGTPGDEWLLDHIHPSIRGHQLIADLLVDELIDQGIVHPTADWKPRQQQHYRAHLSTLDTPYYARGQEHLEGLRKWAQGRVNKLSTMESSAAESK